MKFITVIINLVLCSSTLVLPTAKESHLAFRGKVVQIQLNRADKSSVDCKLTLDIEFTNTGDTPIIIPQPHESTMAETYWQGGVSLALTREDAESHRFVYDLQPWPSVHTDRSFSQFAKQLDQPSPPIELTRIIRAKETWVWRTTTQFRFSQKAYNDGTQTQLGWAEISQVKTPLWLKLAYGIWSHNLERADKNLVTRLRKRWQRFGVLWPDGDPTDRHMITEPMLLKMNEAKLAD